MVGHNFHSVGNLIGSVDPVSQTWSLRWILGTGACNELEGLAHSGGKFYASCENSRTIIEIDPNTGQVSPVLSFADQLLGLTETDDGRLIVGTYRNDAKHLRDLLIVDPQGLRGTETISLNELFVDPVNAQPSDWSDYHRLTGAPYSIQVAPGENFRDIPDPDGLAYRNGRIYMSFDGDLRIFEFSVPEPAGSALFALALTAIALARRRIAAPPA